ncbi:MAG TPA: subclass B3 metallo-beta-lactamase [Chitinophagaceae bacterium]|nr:subclass B3 metallo-beta-lactamase [Chitinophagaceae bacterium]
MTPLKKLLHALLIFIPCLLTFCYTGAQVKEPRITDSTWLKPYPPFRIAGNLYYVGTYDLASYLITTPQGNILINTGTAASADIIRRNIETLGFRFGDIKILLATHAHYDHVGAMAAIKKATGAKIMVDAADAPSMADGGYSDYALGGSVVFAPVKPDRLLHNLDTVQLGDMKITMLHHPGHTRGACSFLFDVNDGQHTYRVLVANMPTIVTAKKFSSISAYPNVEKDYAYTLDTLKKIHFDLWLASHASQFDLAKKHRPGDAYNPEAFRDQKGFDDEIAELQKAYEARKGG